MNHILIILAAFLCVVLFNRTVRWFDDIIHKDWHSRRIDVWTAVTDRATYRLSLSRANNTLVLRRAIFKWGVEKAIMIDYFINLQRGHAQTNPNENILTFSDHIIEDVTKHIAEKYGEIIITSRTIQ